MGGSIGDGVVDEGLGGIEECTVRNVRLGSIVCSVLPANAGEGCYAGGEAEALDDGSPHSWRCSGNVLWRKSAKKYVSCGRRSSPVNGLGRSLVIKPLWDDSRKSLTEVVSRKVWR